MKALIIKQPWIDKILDGSKTWEIRSSNTNVRGTIELIQSKSGLVVGSVEIIGCKELDLNTFRQSIDKHCIEKVDSLPYTKTKTYAWILENPKRYYRPRQYKHPKGAVIWVNLDI